MLRFVLILLLVIASLKGKAQKEYFFWQYTSQNGLISSNVNCITQDSDGFLWIGTNLGLSKFDGSSFTNYNAFDNLTTNEIKEILLLDNNSLLLLHQNGALTLYKDNQFIANYLNLDSVEHITQLNNQTAVLATKKSILAFNNGEYQNYSLPLNENEYITSISSFIDNQLIIGTNEKIMSIVMESKTVNVINSHNTNVTYIATHLDRILAFNNEKLIVLDKDLVVNIDYKINFSVNDIYTDDTTILIGSDKGLYKLDKGKVEKILTKENGLPENHITAFFKDHEQTLWFGLNERGIAGIPHDYFPVLTFNQEYGNLVTHISINDENYLVFDHAITRFNEENIEQVIYNSNSRKITAFYQTQEREKWIGTTNGAFITFPGTNVEYDFKELRNQHVLYIRKMEADNIIIVTKTSAYVYHPSSNRVVELLTNDVKQKFSGITSVIRAKNKLYLFGSGNILVIDNLKVGTLFNWDDPKVKNISFSYLSDNKKGFWIGTLGKGVINYASASDYEFFSENIKLPFKYINASNQKGNELWIASNKGLIKLNLDNNNYTLFNQRHFSSLDVLPQPAFPYGKNWFYFISKRGLIKVETNRYHDSPKPTLRITGFNVSGRSISTDTTIELQYGKYPIVINYNALSISEKVYFQYRLENYQENWSQPTTQKMIEFVDLPPNNYLFEVRLVNPITDWTSEAKNISFVINIPFWKTSLFYILVGIGLGLMVVLIYVGRIIRLKVQKKKLETQVERKTFQLSLQKKHLEQLSYSLSHDLKNPVNNIKGLVEILEENRGDEIIKMLSESTGILETKILSTLSSIKKAQANVKEITEVDILEVNERVKKSLLMLIKENEAQITSKLHVKKIFYEESLLESIIYNLVSNAIKYRHPDRKPYIEVITEADGDYIKLSVSDNGLGLDLNKDKEAIFSIFKRVHKNAEGTGIGLYMIKQMVEINGGRIEVESEPQVGTVFHVYLKDLKEK